MARATGWGPRMAASSTTATPRSTARPPICLPPAPFAGMAAPVVGGYYLVASDGGIFSYPTTNGPAFYGSTGSIALNKPIVGMAPAPGGYYLSGSDGGVFAYPTSGAGPPFLGSTGSIRLNQPIVGISG